MLCSAGSGDLAEMRTPRETHFFGVLNIRFFVKRLVRLQMPEVIEFNALPDTMRCKPGTPRTNQKVF